MSAPMALPHHDGSPLYTEAGRVELGSTVRVWVRVPAGTPLTSVHVRTTPDGDPIFTAAAVDPARQGRSLGGYGATDAWWYADVPVHNPVTNYRFLLRNGDGTVWLNAAGVWDHDVPDADDFLLVSYHPGPQWAVDAIVYEIFPDRFGRAGSSTEPAPDWALPCDWDRDPVIGTGEATPRQFYGGTLDGIAAHLDHLQSLHVDTVYLRPIFPGRSNHRYDASTFDEVDPLLGGEAALARLAAAIHARGMRLIGDITTNHCGDSHEWFRAARSGSDREMFFFRPDGSYECWYGIPTLPKLNWSSQLVRDRMSTVLRRWLEYYDGWRVDCANMTGRQGAQQLTREVATQLREVVTSVRPDALLLAEHNYDASADLDAGGWHGNMNYSGLLRPLWSWLRGEALALPDFLGVPGGVPVRDGVATVASMRSFAAKASWASTSRSWQLVDSYDTPRIATITGSRERQLVAAGLQATLPGAPMLCGGSEFGLTANFGEFARTPMPWNRPHDRNDELLAQYRSLFGLRATEPALRRGGLRWLHAGADLLVFLRETERESLLVAAARAEHDAVTLPIDAPLSHVYGAPAVEPDNGRVRLSAGGPGIRIWRIGGR